MSFFVPFAMAAAVGLIIVYELWAIQKPSRVTITKWTTLNPHFAILVFVTGGLVFGYLLGVAGP